MDPGLHSRSIMPVRTFTDSKGVAWRVWGTIPTADSPLARYYPGGWLTFDAGGDTLRRLSPAPAGWESVGDDRLDLLCRVAEEVPRHTGEMRKLVLPDDADAIPPGDPRPREADANDRDEDRLGR